MLPDIIKSCANCVCTWIAGIAVIIMSISASQTMKIYISFKIIAYIEREMGKG